MNFAPELLRKSWFLAGPTACGKTDVGLLLADRLKAEIICLDSMTLYRGMDVGTAKPTRQQRQMVPHHLVDVIDPDEEFSLAEYVGAAERACNDVVSRGKVPLFVGGTGLYLRGVLRGVFEGPQADWAFRHSLEAKANENSPGWLHSQLASVDPQSADRLHSNDARRIIRALEVLHLTGRPLSDQQQQVPLDPAEGPTHVHWLSPPRDWLYDRIDRRVLQMFDAGLVAEVQGLVQADETMSRTARQGLGYKEVISHLEGAASLPETITAIQTRTRQFAKRQHTWFRNLAECTDVPFTGTESGEQLVERLLS